LWGEDSDTVASETSEDVYYKNSGSTYLDDDAVKASTQGGEQTEGDAAADDEASDGAIDQTSDGGIDMGPSVDGGDQDDEDVGDRDSKKDKKKKKPHRGRRGGKKHKEKQAEKDAEKGKDAETP
jgi:hypothetical protein